MVVGCESAPIDGERSHGFLLHPCVEINLRRTMGHVALSLYKQSRSGQLMTIEYTDNHYKLHLKRTKPTG